MFRRRTPAPPPTKSADRLEEYLDIINSKQTKSGNAKWYDIYRRAGNVAQTDKWINYLIENGLIQGNKKDGYRKTEKGEYLHEVLKNHRDLVGILTRDLRSDRLRPW